MIGNRTYRWQTWATGLANSDNMKNVYKNSFGYTSAKKKVAAGSTTAVLAATATSQSAQTITAGITQPDVPRCLSVTVGGTATNVRDSAVVVTGLNVEGKTITESFQTTASTSGTINGSKAFFSVTSVFIPAQGDALATIAVGTLNKLGVFHRLYPNNTTVKVFAHTTLGDAAVLQAAPTVVANDGFIELNTVSPATTPNGTTYLQICYTYDQWGAADTNDDPIYYTSTSTSTSSTSTSTTTFGTSTSTSSTSSSTSSTSSSTSSTSSSTSSTSTSTTTTP